MLTLYANQPNNRTTKANKEKTMLKLLNKYYTAPITNNAQKLIDYADKHPFAIMTLTPMQCDAFDIIKREHIK
tara:strand:- start:405 stop:623 length:219 start_codon:yes stop_codon:yes gene_type:complete